MSHYFNKPQRHFTNQRNHRRHLTDTALTFANVVWMGIKQLKKHEKTANGDITTELFLAIMMEGKQFSPHKLQRQRHDYIFLYEVGIRLRSNNKTKGNRLH